METAEQIAARLASKPTALIERLLRQVTYEIESKEYTLPAMRAVGELRYRYELGQAVKVCEEILRERDGQAR